MQYQAGGAAGVIGCDDDVVEQGVQEFLAVAVGGRRRGPQGRKVGGDDKELGALTGAEPDGPGGWKIGYMRGMGGGDLASAYDLETAVAAAERPLDELAYRLAENARDRVCS